MTADGVEYLAGFAAPLASEAIAGALPVRQNSPRRPPFGLHAEQLNGVAFTVPRAKNLRSWLYRIRPSVSHGEFEPLAHPSFDLSYMGTNTEPNLLGFRPRPLPSESGVDFVSSLTTVAGTGDPARGPGLALHTYSCSESMVDRALYDADGDLLIIPDTGRLRIATEFGALEVAPGEIAVIQRGMLMAIALIDEAARGFVLEIYGRHFELPERGVIGANGLADARHFQSPVALYEDREVAGGFVIIAKQGGRLFQARRSHSPFDVVAWHGNYLPYRYDLASFNAMGSIGFDHPDPSIYTVLSAPLHHAGQNLADLVVFPNPRWDVAKGTMRPPFYHRNAATELNAIITGPSNSDRVFTRGGLFYTPPFAAHGVSPDVLDRALRASDVDADRPEYLETSSLWIQVESSLPLAFSPALLDSTQRDRDFRSFASGARAYFDPNRRDPFETDGEEPG